MLITHGDAISDLGRVKAEFREDVSQQQGPALDHVGFKYGYFGFFWLDLWNWDGEYCVFHDKTFYPVSRAMAAKLLGASEDSLVTPLNYRFPFGLGIVLGLGALKVLPSLLVRKNKIPAFRQYDPGPLKNPRWTPARSPAGPENALTGGGPAPPMADRMAMLSAGTPAMLPAVPPPIPPCLPEIPPAGNEFPFAAAQAPAVSAPVLPALPAVPAPLPAPAPAPVVSASAHPALPAVPAPVLAPAPAPVVSAPAHPVVPALPAPVPVQSPAPPPRVPEAPAIPPGHSRNTPLLFVPYPANRAG